MSEAPDLDVRPHPKQTGYGIGVIGCGWVARNYQLPAYRHAGFNVVAAADIAPRALNTVCDEFDIKRRFDDFREMLKLPGVDIVEINVPAFNRAEIVARCARAGKHLLVQKPFARSMAEGRLMVEAARQAGVKLAVNSHYRWLNVFRAAHLLVQGGWIGEPYHIHSWMFGNQDDVYVHEMPERRWNASLEDFMQIEWGAHHHDYLRFWTGQEPIEVYARGTRRPGQNFRGEMAYTMVLGFQSGLDAAFVFNQASVAPHGGMGFRIEGTEGMIAGEAFSRLSLYSRRLGQQPAIYEYDENPTPDSYIGTMGDLMDAITEDREHVSSGQDNLNTVRSYLAALESERLGRPVKLSEIT